MKIKFTIFLALILFIGLNANAQSDSNNTITIQGNTYYFRPSTTQSSPPPEQSADFFISGKWYGEDAVRVWASLVDWTIERCLSETVAITGTRNEIVYITAVYIYKKGDEDFGTLRGSSSYDKQIRIDYWLVRNSTQMADGRRASRWFYF